MFTNQTPLQRVERIDSDRLANNASRDARIFPSTSCADGVWNAQRCQVYNLGGLRSQMAVENGIAIGMYKCMLLSLSVSFRITRTPFWKLGELWAAISENAGMINARDAVGGCILFIRLP